MPASNLPSAYHDTHEMQSFRAKRALHVPAHPREPQLTDVLNMMRNRDIHELLKAKRKGELDQMLQGLYASVISEHPTNFEGGAFQGELESEGMDESKANESTIDPQNFNYPYGGNARKIGDVPTVDQQVGELEIKQNEKEIQRVTLPASKGQVEEGKSIVVRESASFLYHPPVPPPRQKGSDKGSSSSPTGDDQSDFSLSVSESNMMNPRHSLHSSHTHSPSSTIDTSRSASWRAGAPRVPSGAESAYRYSLRSHVGGGGGGTPKSGTMHSEMSGRLSMRSHESHDPFSDGDETDYEERTMSRLSGRALPVFPYETLKSRGSHNASSFPPGVDRHNREQHLSEEEFMSIFKMDKTSFNKLTRWRRQELKKRYNLS
mmetsp:Transcript_250/g.235  ORF Transcript_250/g.235 Transcript_250/m.235 type:complete len:376 (+) Transcript_250:222-1349(+)|eukprot:CAMPEP_0182417452 /NCGR_PEP_ID=MMETSP1167-20130531/1943_1 /TAXON_ID=2988 /ORGANISM="Mallomonas Sp, Strain CCMP3275" /LENGTH=375 /DNA_ID=CAMNT_0024591053 /DNA_START=177 /DNA_END=1307 /DNA_ORIENTATION=+